MVSLFVRADEKNVVYLCLPLSYSLSSSQWWTGALSHDYQYDSMRSKLLLFCLFFPSLPLDEKMRKYESIIFEVGPTGNYFDVVYEKILCVRLAKCSSIIKTNEGCITARKERCCKDKTNVNYFVCLHFFGTIEPPCSSIEQHQS